MREASSGRCISSEHIRDRVAPEDASVLEATYKGVDGGICFKSLLPLAFRALEAGADIYEVSSLLNWRDFEELVLEYAKLSGLEGLRGLRTTLRRYEYDVIAVNLLSGAGLIVDCKHWSPGYGKKGKLKYVASVHALKCRYLINECDVLSKNYGIIRKAKWFIPTLVTLTEVIRGPLEGTLVVPIRMLRDFMVNLEYYVDLIREPGLKILNKCWSTGPSSRGE
ncbi:MAG: hypothetical protein QXM76_05485 [Zestosphaera sp.]